MIFFLVPLGFCSESPCLSLRTSRLLFLLIRVYITWSLLSSWGVSACTEHILFLFIKIPFPFPPTSLCLFLNLFLLLLLLLLLAHVYTYNDWIYCGYCVVRCFSPALPFFPLPVSWTPSYILLFLSIRPVFCSLFGHCFTQTSDNVYLRVWLTFHSALCFAGSSMKYRYSCYHTACFILHAWFHFLLLLS